MLSSSRRLIVPLFVYLSLLLVTTVDAHDATHLKRMMKMRALVGGSDPVLPNPVVGAAAIPSLSSSSTDASSSTSASSSSSSSSSTSATGTSTSSSSSSTSASASTTQSSSSTTSSSSTSSSTQSSTSSTSSSTSAQTSTSASLNIIQQQEPSTSTFVPTLTVFSSVPSSTPTDTTAAAAAAPLSAAAKDDDSKSKTLTALIAVAASLGGIAILWTVFRKWKLSSSKKFDERLRPIDWQQPTADDGVFPIHRRHSGASSFRSGPGHSDAPSRVHDTLDHDFTAGASTVGGYADLSRGPSPLPPMQEKLVRGPSFNRTYDNSVPLHYQGYDGTRY